jgi:hypothetical protein
MPWDIPSEQQLRNMYELLEPHLGVYLWDQGDWNRYKRGGTSYSAAAATIWFLNSVSVKTRLRLRKVIVDEDRSSESHPECHSQGLIAFCLESTHLRLERRVNLRKCGLQDGRRIPWKALYTRLAIPQQTPTSHPEGLCINTTVYSWIVEANVLPALGMPKGAFSLLFGATPYLDHGVALFRAVKWLHVISDWRSWR